MAYITECATCYKDESYGPSVTYYKRRMVQSFPTRDGKRHYHAGDLESTSMAGIKRLVRESED